MFFHQTQHSSCASRFEGALTILADSDASTVGGFSCSSPSTVNIPSSSSLEITSTTIDLACNVSGGGDLALTCDHGCGIVIGNEFNIYSPTTSYHLSDSELGGILSTGTVTIGSESKNVSNILFDGAHATSSASNLNVLTSQGSISFENSSSAFDMTANSALLVMRARHNLTVDSHTQVNFTGGGYHVFNITGTSAVLILFSLPICTHQ